MSQTLKEFWSNIDKVRAASPEDIQRDVLAYLNHIDRLTREISELRDNNTDLQDHLDELDEEHELRISARKDLKDLRIAKLEDKVRHTEIGASNERILKDAVIEQYNKLESGIQQLREDYDRRIESIKKMIVTEKNEYTQVRLEGKRQAYAALLYELDRLMRGESEQP